MSVTVNCRKCSKLLRSSDEYAGWRVRCPDCQTLNQFPEAGQDEPAAESEHRRVEPEAVDVCRLCGKDLLEHEDQVQDTKGSLFHRKCYEEEVARLQAASTPSEICFLCGAELSAEADSVKDTKGNVYHRGCYHEEQARQQAKRKPRKTCRLCGKDLKAGMDRVKDTQGNVYHRTCYEQERARRQRKQEPKEACSLCGKGFHADSDRVKDTQGTAYHRTCYENERARRQAPTQSRRVCSLCGQDFSVETGQVQDTRGTLYHRSCYERERTRRQGRGATTGLPVGQQPATAVDGLTAISGGPDELLVELEPAPAPQPMAPSSLASAPPASTMGPARRPQLGPWLYVLIGVGVAVPLCFLVFIVVQAVGGKDATDRGPVARVDGDLWRAEMERRLYGSSLTRKLFPPRLKLSARLKLVFRYGSAKLFMRSLLQLVFFLAIVASAGIGGLLLACKVLGERVPKLPAAARVVLMVFAISIVLNMIGLEITGRNVSLAIVPVDVAIAAFFFAGLVRVALGRALLVSGIYNAVVFATGFLLAWTFGQF
jgi:phage FluMu protein Com